MRRLLREPLVHFLALGAALFLFFHFRSDRAGASPGRLVVTAGRIAALAATFERSWQRPPTPPELDHLVEEWIRDEVLYREALARGLDLDDAIVRRRLRQKLEFVADDLAALAPPTEPELAEFLRTHGDAYRVDSRLAIRQVRVDRQRRGTSAAADAQALLEKLRALGPDADTAELGDPLRLLSESGGLEPRGELVEKFGEEFVAAVEQLAPRVWSGPIESGFGLHLVLLAEREEGSIPPLSDVRAAVVRDWTAARRTVLAEAFYRGLRSRYEIVIEPPESAR